uniref:Uncharacterized protein n=1 Tax=Mustela putorius furo TaxID=9669 RepID=M3XRI1_MUSPF
RPSLEAPRILALSLLLSRGERCALVAAAAGSVRRPRGKERGAFKARGEEPPPGGVSVSAAAAAAAPRSPSPPPPSLALGARGCAPPSGSRRLPARPPPPAPPRGPPLPLPAYLTRSERLARPDVVGVRAGFLPDAPRLTWMSHHPLQWKVAPWRSE